MSVPIQPPPHRPKRRLAAILAADVVGYSRLMGQDETGTLDAFKAVRRDRVDPRIAEHGGRIVKTTGDGLLVEFPSVVEAVQCAVAIQQGVALGNAGVPEARRIRFRIGINLGDVIHDGGDVFGDGVNIAARLEGLADTGGICISGAVHDQLIGKGDLSFENIGEHTLKNIARPTRVWRWTGVPAGPRVALPSIPEKASIAVLPFDNLSGQAEETYFCDGITEDLITGLARFRSLFVIARNSSFAFRGKPVEIPEIGRTLGVQFVLEGSVRRAGDRVRITAQLIEASTGGHVWAERYDRKLDDIFAVQDEVMRMIVANLVRRIEETGLQRSARMPTSSLGVYDLLLRGLSYFRGYGEDDNRLALEMFERAATLDPHCALAHAYAAFVQVAIHGYESTPEEVLDAAHIRGRLAVDLDPQEGRCHRLLALTCLYRRDWQAAEHHGHRALELNPNDADGRMQLGYVLALSGRAEEGIELMEEAMRLNPISPIWYNSDLGDAFYSLRRYAEAIQAHCRLPHPDPSTLARLAAAYAQVGDLPAAHHRAEAVLQSRPDFSTGEFLRQSVKLKLPRDIDHLREGLLKAGLPE